MVIVLLTLVAEVLPLHAPQERTVAAAVPPLLTIQVDVLLGLIAVRRLLAVLEDVLQVPTVDLP